MIKDHGPLRKASRGKYVHRVQRAYADRLNEQWSRDDGAVHTSGRRQRAVMHTLSERNWRVQRQGREVVAIEPGRVYETPFRGDNAFWEAVEFAAAELRKDEDDRTDVA